jgi:hypothetical protein
VGENIHWASRVPLRLGQDQASGFFVPFVMNKRRNWSFQSWEDISAEGMGPCDAECVISPVAPPADWFMFSLTK